MAKKVAGTFKLQIKGGEATMAPPVGPAFGQRGLPGMEFVKQFNAKTGQRSWLQRMGRHFSASLVNGGGLVYFLDDDGNTTVIKPGDEYQVISKNTIADAFYSSPAISQGQIFLRSETHLYAIGQSTKTASAK